MLTPAHLELLGLNTPKFLATLGPDGRPNVVPVLSISPGDDPGVLLFGEFMINKTRRNLEANPRLAVLVVSQDLAFFTVRGRLVDFRRSGPEFDRVSSQPLFRYNPYTGLRSVGIMQVERASEIGHLSAAAVVLSVLVRRLRAATAARAVHAEGKTTPFPRPVREKFSRLKALKVLAWAGEDGYPRVVLDPGMVPGGPGLVVHPGSRLPGGIPLAAAVLTPDPVAYQVKGRLAGDGGSTGARWLHVTEVYSACPPLPGELIWREEPGEPRGAAR